MRFRPDSMNWTCIVYGGPMIGVLIWWVIDARKWFKGPKVNVEHRLIHRVERGIVRKESNDYGPEIVQKMESVSP